MAGREGHPLGRVKADGSGDIAVLRLDGPAPAEAKIARLVKSEDYSDHPFRAFGYPPRQEDGVPSTGKLEIRNAKGWVVMRTTEITGFRVQRGFSGSAVWDGDLDGVAGMVVAEESDPAPRIAYMIPAQVLIEAWPELGQQAIRSCPYRGLFAFRELRRALLLWPRGRHTAPARRRAPQAAGRSDWRLRQRQIIVGRRGVDPCTPYPGHLGRGHLSALWRTTEIVSRGACAAAWNPR